MRVLKFSSLLLCSLSFIVKGDAQSPRSPAEGPVWVMEFIEAQPGKMLLTLGYLDDYWMRVREEAKRQGVVLSYQRFSEMRLGGEDVTGATPSYKSDPNAIALLTEYKNLNAFRESGVVFASILRHLPNTTPGLVPHRPEEPYQTVETRVFMEQPANPDKSYIVESQFTLITKK